MSTPERPRATTRDVAKRAGVSQPTVSLVLSRNPKARVSAETRERVLRAAEELGYRPNVVARSPRGWKMRQLTRAEKNSGMTGVPIAASGAGPRIR